MERESGFRVDNRWLPERTGMVRLAFNGREEKCLISRGCGWTHVLLLARKLLAADLDDDGVHLLAVFLVIDAGAHQGHADVMRILAWLAAPRARAKEMPTIALPDLPHETRCHLFDNSAPWRLPLLRRLAPQAAGASATDQMPWVDIPAWLDAIEVVDDYRDRTDLATKRDLIVRDIPKSGFLRRLAPPPDTDLIEALVEEYPNFAPVIEHTADQLAIAALGNGWLRLPAVLLLGEPGIGKSVFADALAATLGVKCRRFTMSHATQGGALGGLAAYWGTGTTGEVFNVLLRGEALNPVFVLDEIDKAAGTTEGRYNPLGPLHCLLEPEDAKQFVDEYAGVPIDASWFSWVATANDLHVLPAPIVSRLLVFDIRLPNRAELRQIGRRQYRRLVDDCGLAGYLPVEAPATLLDQVEGNPRELHILMQQAIGRMARDCKAGRELRVIAPPPAPGHRRGMGFV